jgi:hypothetical protein
MKQRIITNENGGINVEQNKNATKEEFLNLPLKTPPTDIKEKKLNRMGGK